MTMKRAHYSIRLSQIVDASDETLKQAPCQRVEPGSVLRTDGWEGYNILAKYGYTHKGSRHKNSE